MSDRLRDALFDKRHAIHRLAEPRRKALCRFDGRRLIRGTASLHRHPLARKWRPKLRLIHSRLPSVANGITRHTTNTINDATGDPHG